MAKAIESRMAKVLDTDVKVGDSWELGPMFPGIDKEPLVATVILKHERDATVELKMYGVTVEFVVIKKLSHSTSVVCGGTV